MEPTTATPSHSPLGAAVASLRAAIASGQDPRASAAWRSLDVAAKLAALQQLALADEDAAAELPPSRKRARGGATTAAPAPAAAAVSPMRAQCALIMHAMGDAPLVCQECCALVERDATAYTQRLLRDLRTLVARTDGAVRVGDFAAHLPATTKVYFRWKALKGLSAAEPALATTASPAWAAADGSANRGEGEGEDEDEAAGAEDEAALLLPAGAEAEDEEEARQLTRLQAAAEEELRASAASSGSSSSSCSGPETGGTAISDFSPAMRTFRLRLAFANARSRLMTTAQYDIYKRAREASFTGGRRGQLARHFAALLPPPALSKAALEVAAFLAYDRVGAVVEAAVRVRAGGGAEAPLVAAAELLELPLPLAAYREALRAVPPLPAELGDVVRDLLERARHRAEAAQLAEAREAQRALLAAARASEAAADGPGALSAVGPAGAGAVVSPSYDRDADAAFLQSMGL